MIKSRDSYELTHYCNNCGKKGHTYNQCSKPITSIGIIVLTKSYDIIKYLMICRKDSLGYVEFLRGKYNLYDKVYIQNLIDEMTIHEKQKLLTKSFSILWNELWGKFSHTQYRQEEKSSSDKMNELKKGVYDVHTDTLFNLENLIKKSKTNWIEPEWGFPKGRRNYQENDILCALREFEEETGYSRKEPCMINNIKPFQEIFTGSNYKSYKHKYFLAYIDNPKQHSNFQKSEVSQMKWLSLEECLKKIRPYNLERIELINNINKVLHKYSLIS
tara:strand:- start:499 stop:1317 length:819 start_codon:yes stop_codon:yes gene_type:complete